MNLEELKLKARYVDADCIVGLDKQIGPLLASIIRDLLALGRKAKASVPKEAKRQRCSPLMTASARIAGSCGGCGRGESGIQKSP